MEIRELTEENFADWVALQIALWPDEPKEEIEKESERLLSETGYKNFGAFEGSELVGFANISIRNDYVAGATKYPVGYLEGIYVKPEFRGKGIARDLEKAGEEWANSKGCSEMASDAEIENEDSHKFHTSLGFREDNRIVCYIKRINKKL